MAVLSMPSLRGEPPSAPGAGTFDGTGRGRVGDVLRFVLRVGLVATTGTALAGLRALAAALALVVLVWGAKRLGVLARRPVFAGSVLTRPRLGLLVFSTALKGSRVGLGSAGRPSSSSSSPSAPESSASLS